MDVKFYLKDPQKKGDTAIFARISNAFYSETPDGQRKYNQVKIYFSEIKIDPQFWDKKKCRAKQTSKFNIYPEFNQRINDLENDLKNLFLELSKKNKRLTPDQFKQAWAERNQPAPTESTPENDFVKFAESHIKNIKSKATIGTIKSFNNSLRHIREFAESKNVSLAIDSIGFDFHYSLVEYLKTEMNFGTNTIWRINKFLKYILKYAAEKGIKTRPDFTSKRFSVPAHEPEPIYLTETELQNIYNTPQNSTKLERVKDLFLIGCYTGLRFSDFSRLNSQNINEKKGKYYFRITTKKTGEPVYIPLHPIVTNIINKYSGGIPKPLSNQKFNDYIKNVCEFAGISEPVTIEETKGNLTTPRTAPKFKLVSSHTARRSFCTNAFKAGIPIPSLMLISGHRTETAFLRYIRISKEENAELLSEHPFFNTPNLKIAK